MWRLCKEFGLSGRGLGKLCERWKIPVPPRGYWARIAAGAEIARPALPPLPSSVSIRIAPSAERPAPTSLPEIPIPERLTAPHPLVRQTRENRQASRPPTDTSLDLRVSKGSLPRALRIVDVVIKELERRGHSVVVQGSRQTLAVVGGEEIGFYIEERSTRHVLEGSEEEQQKPWYRPRFDFTPSGKLSLRIDGYSRDIQQGWSDGVRRKVEDVLPEFLDALERSAEREKIRRQERLEDERRWAEARRLRLEEERRAKELEEHLTLSRRISEMRQYLSFADSLHETQADGNWLEWVRGHLAASENLLRSRIARSGQSKLH